MSSRPLLYKLLSLPQVIWQGLGIRANRTKFHADCFSYTLPYQPKKPKMLHHPKVKDCGKFPVLIPPSLFHNQWPWKMPTTCLPWLSPQKLRPHLSCQAHVILPNMPLISNIYHYNPLLQWSGLGWVVMWKFRMWIMGIRKVFDLIRGF